LKVLRVAALLFGPEDDVTMSGGTRFFLEVWKSWRKLPFQFELLSSGAAHRLLRYFRYEDLADRARVVNVRQVGFFPIDIFLRAIVATIAIFRLGKVDVIFASSSFCVDLLPAAIYKMCYSATKVIAPVFHLVPSPAERPGSPVRNVFAWLEQRSMITILSKITDIIVVDNAKLVEELVSIGVSKERCYVTSMGVTVYACTDVEGNGYDAIFIGRLAEIKGIPILLEAWKKIVVSFPQAILALGGIEQPGLDLSRRISDLALEKNVVHLAGLSDEQVSQAYKRSKLFVTASKEEGYGISILEAFAYGKPAVTFDLPAFREAFPIGREIANGFHADNLADAILRTLSDSEHYDRLCKEVASFKIQSWDNIADGLASRCFASS
jgi:glycosyltransferase involved in cell wall biosynthesis